MHQSSPHFDIDSSRSARVAVSSGPAAATVVKSRDVAGRSDSTLFSQRTNSLLGVQILATGSYVPDNVVTNDDLKDIRGFDPEWVEQRTGIYERRHAPAGMDTSDLAVNAARRAIEQSGVDPRDIDLLVVGTFSPDYYCPSTACLVQEKLGLDVPAFDLQAACSGFIYSMVTAAQFVATGNSKLALVIGADCNSRIVDQTDRSIAPLFGDGAGAVLLSRGDAHQGLMCYQMGADGSGGPLLSMPVGGTHSPTSVDDLQHGRQYLQMDGRNVFK
ncbi:MAG: 3-oxoacyl-ACP synthase, partial [Planctomycetaceae bacterium]|nr:3-oxoacyl-ACP synthase [Planctomycetaceae bacterium]